jgi:4-hydroxyphenylpyruvate dioxygenase
LIDAVDRPGLGVMVDSWHFFAGPSTWDDLEHLPTAHLGFVQLSDAAPPMSDDVADEYRHHRVLPGDGQHDVAAFAAAVQRRFGPVTVSVEVLSRPWRQRPLETFATATLTATRQLWERAAPRDDERPMVDRSMRTPLARDLTASDDDQMEGGPS